MHIENVHKSWLVRNEGGGDNAVCSVFLQLAHPQSIMQYEKPRLVRGKRKIEKHLRQFLNSK